MSRFNQFARRLKQIHLLFQPPEDLRREHERFEIAAALDILDAHGHEKPHMTTDISHGGIFVEPRIAGEPGDSIHVSVGALLRNAKAEIVIHRGDGTAVRFASPVHGAALTAWLVNHPARPLRH
ncbi:PilZ domain-containing protein [Minwuia sp.]|uniref:PilZ domain-containing protein n=1 Tax=Minwuia sp. TaxID=2493630 RepID=UPI003A8EAA93